MFCGLHQNQSISPIGSQPTYKKVLVVVYPVRDPTRHASPIPQGSTTFVNESKLFDASRVFVFSWYLRKWRMQNISLVTLNQCARHERERTCFDYYYCYRSRIAQRGGDYIVINLVLFLMCHGYDVKQTGGRVRELWQPLFQFARYAAWLAQRFHPTNTSPRGDLKRNDTFAESLLRLEIGKT